MSLPPTPLRSIPAKNAAKPIKVLIVDDSVVVRGLVSRWVEQEDGMEVVAKAIDGIQGVSMAGKYLPDVVVLDIEMPRMDGLTALPQIIKAAPKTKVVMASTLTHRNADIALRALAKGASDYTPKPESGRLGNADEFRTILVGKIRALGTPTPTPTRRPLGHKAAPVARAISAKPQVFARPDALFIGSSTGGPQALRQLMSVIGRRTEQPIFITQHMPKTFTTVLAEHLTKASGKRVVEGAEGMPVKPGGVYLAPGDYHMTVRKAGPAVVIALDQKPPENYCRPSVDPLFRSAAVIYGKRAMAIMLTGMGHDGCDGTQAMFDAGSRVIVQDEASSVVWGMPGAVAAAGLAHQILPLTKIGPNVLRIVQGK